MFEWNYPPFLSASTRLCSSVVLGSCIALSVFRLEMSVAGGSGAGGAAPPTDDPHVCKHCGKFSPKKCNKDKHEKLCQGTYPIFKKII